MKRYQLLDTPHKRKVLLMITLLLMLYTESFPQDCSDLLRELKDNDKLEEMVNGNKINQKFFDQKIYPCLSTVSISEKEKIVQDINHMLDEYDQKRINDRTEDIKKMSASLAQIKTDITKLEKDKKEIDATSNQLKKLENDVKKNGHKNLTAEMDHLKKKLKNLKDTHEKKKQSIREQLVKLENDAKNINAEPVLTKIKSLENEVNN